MPHGDTDSIVSYEIVSFHDEHIDFCIASYECLVIPYAYNFFFNSDKCLRVEVFICCLTFIKKNYDGRGKMFK